MCVRWVWLYVRFGSKFALGYFCNLNPIDAMPSHLIPFVFMLGFSFLMAVICCFKAVLNHYDKASFYCSLTYGCLFFNCLLIVLDFDIGHWGYPSFGGLESTPALWFNHLTPICMLLFYREFLEIKQYSPQYYRLFSWGVYILLLTVVLHIVFTLSNASRPIFEAVIQAFQYVLLALFVALPIYALRFWRHPVYRYAAWSSWSIVVLFSIFLLFYTSNIELPSWIGDNLLFMISVIDGVLFWVALTVRDSQLAKAKAVFEKQAITNEIRALRSQMNPHFIFNSLNAIKAYNLNHDTERTDLYLTKFSRLMRQVLENSAVEKITLENELNTLDLYLEMEKLRAGEKLDYEILVSDDIESIFVEIPPLLIQPYVENAIWHGLLHKEGGGKVTIDVRQSNEKSIQITIIDNGIGRKAAARYGKTTKRQSLGTKITEERIKNLANAHVKIEDLEVGTSVIIEIQL